MDILCRRYNEMKDTEKKRVYKPRIEINGVQIQGSNNNNNQKQAKLLLFF